MTKRRSISISLLCIVLVLSSSIVAYAASASETAYVYGFDYGDVNTTAIAAQEQMYLNNLGYQTYCNTTVESSFAIGTSPTTGTSRMNCGVFSFNGHASAGSCEFYNDTYLTAKKTGGDYVKFDTLDMSNCKAAFFFGCKTASDARASTYGVLTEEAVDNGATCSFGWNKSVYTDVATQYRERIFYFLRYGYTVNDAAANAASEMPWLDETRSYSIEGNGGISLTLARSGVASDKQIPYNTAMQLISNENYHLVDTLSNGTEVYVRYMGDFPTLESIDLNRNEQIAYYSGVSYNETDQQFIASVPSTISEVQTYSLENSLTIDGTIYNKTSEDNSLDVLCKINNVATLVRITKAEYTSANGETNYLNVKCTNLLTGNEIDYMDIINSMM